MVRRVAGRILRVTVSLLVALGYVLISRLRTKEDSLFSILIYHSVSAGEAARFARQMDALLKIATPVAAVPPHEDTMGNTAVAVTFDDGYRSFRDHALPELVKRNIPATVFVPSRLLGEKPGFSSTGRTLPDETIMTAEDLLNLPPDLITVGSHCQTHPHLSGLDGEKVWEEIAGSRKDLETLLKRPVLFLAFPYGEYSQESIDLSKRAGYQRVFSALPTGDDGFLYGRIETDPKDWPLEFKLKVRGAYRWLPWAVDLKRKVRRFFRWTT